MVNISNINSSVSCSSKSFGKLTFELGEVFAAKTENINTETGEAVLKTKEGWTFSAKLQNPLELDKNEYNNFVVEDYENGQLGIKVIQASGNNADDTESSMTAILKQYCDGGDTEDINLVKALIKHEIPLTKQNISEVKTILEFRKNIIDNPLKENDFIKNYLNSKGIDENSEKGMQIKNILKGFFANLKGIDLGEIAAFKENGIELTGENIKSFNNVFKGDSVMYKSLKEISNLISTETSQTDNQSIDSRVEILKGDGVTAQSLESTQETKPISIKNAEINPSTSKLSVDIDNISNIDSEDSSDARNIEKTIVPSGKTILEFKREILTSEDKIKGLISNYFKENAISESSIRGVVLKGSFNVLFDELKGMSVSEIKNILQNGGEAKGINLGNITYFIKEDPVAFNEVKRIMSDLEKLAHKVDKNLDVKQNEVKENNNKENISESETNNSQVNDTLVTKGVNIRSENINLGKHVHNEINSKISEMKSMLTNMIKENNPSSPMFEKVIAALNNNINDFKVFNTVSNEYYYVDVPVNFQTNEYNCKLIVKDDRKSGKKLDSTNIKIAASVNTVNMGIVDAFVSVNNKSITVDIKAEPKFTKILEISKKSLVSKIVDKGYIINLNVKKKENLEQLNLVNCREFFNDDNMSGLDMRV